MPTCTFTMSIVLMLTSAVSMPYCSTSFGRCVVSPEQYSSLGTVLLCLIEYAGNELEDPTQPARVGSDFVHVSQGFHSAHALHLSQA